MLEGRDWEVVVGWEGAGEVERVLVNFMDVVDVLAKDWLSFPSRNGDEELRGMENVIPC